MRELDAARITEVVARLCVEANRHLPQDVKNCIACAREKEQWAPAQEILDRIKENYEIADRDEMAICQDTGMACVFLEIGQDVHINGNIADAVNAGVKKGYGEGFLRKSVVRDPLDRVNTGDNTPAMLYTDIVPGDQVKVTVAPKGFGSENMSQLKMLKPSDGLQGVKDFVVKVVEEAAPIPVLPSWWAWALAVPLTRPLCWPRRPSSALLKSAMPTPSTPIWRLNCWRRSTLWASDLRASAARPPLWQ